MSKESKLRAGPRIRNAVARHRLGTGAERGTAVCRPDRRDPQRWSWAERCSALQSNPSSGPRRRVRTPVAVHLLPLEKGKYFLLRRRAVTSRVGV